MNTFNTKDTQRLLGLALSLGGLSPFVGSAVRLGFLTYNLNRISITQSYYKRCTGTLPFPFDHRLLFNILPKTKQLSIAVAHASINPARWYSFKMVRIG